MSFNHARQNHNYVPEYQLSGIPFVTSSTATECPNGTIPVGVQFPHVTRWVVIKNIGSNSLNFGVTSQGAKPNADDKSDNQAYFTLAAGDITPRLELRTRSLYFIGSGGTTGFSVIAGLTSVSESQFLVLSASQGWQGVG